MPSFGGLYTVRTGLSAAQRALEIIGQNVSNAATSGYTRQEVAFAASEPSPVIQGGGRGITDATVLRYRDDFLDRQFRTRSGAQGFHEARSMQLSQVEEIVGDLSEGGLRIALDEFFNSWHNLSLQPSDTSARGLVVQAAEQFLYQAKAANQGLADLRVSLDEAIRNKVDEINSAARQVAQLNHTIMVGEAGNKNQANDLRDQRDKLLDAMAKLTGTSTITQPDGTVTVQLGGFNLVDRDAAYPIDTTSALEPDMDADPSIVSTRQFTASFTWNGTAVQPRFSSGEVGALLELRDQTVPDYMKYLDNLVRTVATQVNTLHNAGVPAASQVDIFNIAQDWMAVDVNPAVETNPGLIVAAGILPAANGDGDRARQIGALRDATFLTDASATPWTRPLVGSKTVTPGEYLRTISTILGLQVQQAQRSSESSAKQVEMAEKQRQSVSGVSLDDEMTKMIQYQQGYNAAARMMTTIDEMLDTLINRVGTVGR